jgi:hypothetical protein
VVVDPKGHDYSVYRGATLITPNRQDLGAAVHRPGEFQTALLGRITPASTRSNGGLAVLANMTDLRCPAGHEFAFPVKGVAHDGRKVIVARPPAELAARPFGVRHDLRRIARPARRDVDLEIDARDPLDRVDHVQHREAVAVTAIERRRGGTPERT